MQLKNTEKAKNGDTGYIRNLRIVSSKEDPSTKYYEADIEFYEDCGPITFSGDELKSLDLAYCSTVHKAQGEEFQNVIMVVSNAHPTMLRRAIIYTGLTRSKMNACIIGESSALKRAIDCTVSDVRHTNLAERIRYFSNLMQKK